MALYMKQIKPMSEPPSFQGANNMPTPVEDGDIWYPEEDKNLLIEKFKEEVEGNYSWNRLIFYERYVKLED